MTVNSPVCFGCFLNNPLPPTPMSMPPAFLHHVPYPVPAVESLTDEELEVLRHLGEAWNLFVTLDRKHPDDNDEFRHAIHAAQQIVALRVARRVNPSVWLQPEE